MNLDIDLTPFSKNISKWMLNLNLKYKTIKVLDNPEFGDNFFMKERIGQVDQSKRKNRG